VTEQTGRRRDAVHTAAPEGRPRRLDGSDVVEQMETGVVERSWRGGERTGRRCQESAGGEISPGGKRRVGVNIPRRMGSQTPIYFGPGTNRDAGVQPREISGNPPRIGPSKGALRVFHSPHTIHSNRSNRISLHCRLYCYTRKRESMCATTNRHRCSPRADASEDPLLLEDEGVSIQGLEGWWKEEVPQRV
jgi:hypothetical protein